MESELTLRRAMRRIVEYLAHEKADYELCNPALKGRHIYNAVRVLQQELTRQQVVEARAAERRAPTQGY